MTNINALAENIKAVLSNDIQIKNEVIELIETLPTKELEVLQAQIKKTPAIEIAEDYLTKNYKIRNNVIANRFEYSKISEDNFSYLNADEINREFQKRKLKFSLGSIKSLLKSDYVPEYNPFKAYYESLPKWQITDKDYITELANHVKTSNQKRFIYHFKKHIVRTVACSIDNSIVNKQCLTFTGGQNNGKSTFCRFLCPPNLSEYIAENIGTDKDSLIALAENLIINLDELSTLNKSEINALKSVFSKDVIKVRRPYAENATMANRVASFVGNTNRTEFLSDETGSVRWLIFEVESIDFAYSKLDIDLVYSQAYSLYKDGFEHQLTIEDVKENDEINKQYQITTTEMELIASNYQPITKDEYNANKTKAGYDSASMTELINELSENRKQYIDQNKLIQALKHYGFEKMSVRKAKGLPYSAYIFKRVHNLNPEKIQENKDLDYPKEWDN